MTVALATFSPPSAGRQTVSALPGGAGQGADHMVCDAFLKLGIEVYLRRA